MNELTPKTKPDDVEQLDLLWGLESIGAMIGRNRNQTYYLLAKGRLPGRLVCGRWCASRRQLREFFANALGGHASGGRS